MAGVSFFLAARLVRPKIQQRIRRRGGAEAFLFRQVSEKIVLFLAAKWEKFSRMLPAALSDAHRAEFSRRAGELLPFDSLETANF